MQASTLRVFIIDDHAVVRDGLKYAFAQMGGIEAVGDASTAADALQWLRARSSAIDAVLLDVSLPDRSGLALLADIKRDTPGLPVIVFSSLPEREYAFQVLREGASGFVSKTSDPQALLRTVRTAVCNSARSSASAARVLPSQGAQPRAMHETLSPREREIFMALARGRRVTEIGSALKLSKKTVSTYRQRILDKTGFTTNSELTRYALQHELLN